MSRKTIDQAQDASPPKDGYLWEGVHPHYRDVPAIGKQFDGDVWLKKTRSYTENIISAPETGNSIHWNTIGEHMLLPLAVSLLAASANNKVRILDFGGGMGVTYAHLINSLTDLSGIDYHIVERPGICEGGAKLFAQDDRIHFCDHLPNDFPDLDVVYLCSALQYIEDYSALLKRLAAYQARYFFFVKLSAGDFPTYATAQRNVSGTIIPYWFINKDEIIELMRESGYGLIYKTVLEQEYDQSNFPEEYRMGRACNLLFRLG